MLKMTTMRVETDPTWINFNTFYLKENWTYKYGQFTILCIINIIQLILSVKNFENECSICYLLNYLLIISPV